MSATVGQFLSTAMKKIPQLLDVLPLSQSTALVMITSAVTDKPLKCMHFGYPQLSFPFWGVWSL